ncbi:MAG: sulfatase-like hydrolase/transferase [Planctomycetota bacterium]|jgi:arylsulfatase A-like enzyme
MTDPHGQLSRRQFLRSAATVAGGAMLAPAATWMLTSGHRRELPASVPASRSERPNVLLIVMDTARADRMSCYGYHRPTTPGLEAFADDARLYTNALSPASWTLPSHAAMFTGLTSSAHGATWAHCQLDPKFPTLADQLRTAGYQTVGLSCNNVWVSPGCGMDRGFDVFWNAHTAPDVIPLREHITQLLRGDPRRLEASSAASAMHRQLGDWFERDYDPDRPFFAFMNYIEPHDPYIPPVERLQWASTELADKWRDNQDLDRMWQHMLTGVNVVAREDIDELSLLYDEEIAFTDRKITELLTFLSANGLADNTLVIITADHGEHFNEHHLLIHHYSLHEPLVRVPLMARFPGSLSAGRDDSLVQSHDVYPTILQAAGVDWLPEPVHTCRSLLDAPDPSRWAVSEYLAPYLTPLATVATLYRQVDYSRFLRKLWASQMGHMKLIRSSDGDVELYDLSVDFLEKRNVADEQPETAQMLAEKLEGWLGSFAHYEPPAIPPAELKELDPEQLDALRGLGYVR